MAYKRIEVIYTNKQGNEYVLYETNKSPSPKHAVNLYKKSIDRESTYQDECMYVGEKLLLSNITGRWK